MKKLLLFFAALCCAMVMNVLPAEASKLADNATIVINEVLITAENKDSVPANYTSGKVSYDDENHILTLDNLVLSYPVTGSRSQAIYINVTDLDADFIIRIKGSNGYINALNKLPLAFYGKTSTGRGLIIEGDGETTFSATKATETYSGSAIVCNGSLTIRNGVKIQARNSGLKGGDAIKCHHLNLIQAYLSILATDAPIGATEPSQNVFEKVYVVNSQEHALTYNFYDKDYPVWVSGKRLNDVQCELTSSTTSTITEGTLRYNAASRTLTLDGLKMTTNSAPIRIEDTEDPVTLITVVLEGSGGAVACNYSEPALNCVTPVIIQNKMTSGSTFIFKSIGTHAISHASNLTFTGLTEDAKVDVISMGTDCHGIYGTGTNAKLTINSCNVSSFGQGACINEPAHELINVAISSPSGAVWNTGNPSPTDGKGQPVKSETLKFQKTKSFVSVSANPVDGGSVAIKYGGSEKTNPYYYEGTSLSNVELNATAKEGYAFAFWNASESDNTATKKVNVSGNAEYVAHFAYDPKLTDPFYLLDQKTIKTLPANLRDAMSDVATMDIFPSRKWVTYHNGKLYYLEPETKTKDLFMSVPFTPDKSTKIGAKKIEIDIDGYYNATGLVYSETEDCFYTMFDHVNYTSTALSHLLFRIKNGQYEEVMGYDFKNCTTLAMDEDGIFYTIKKNTVNCQLLRINPKEGTVETISTLPAEITNPTQLFYDPKRSRFMLLDSGSSYGRFYLMDPTDSKWVLAGVEPLSLPYGKFFVLPIQQQKITVQTATYQETWGTVEIKECGCSSKKFDVGTSLTLTATAATGYEFVEWSDYVKTATRTVTVGTDDATYTAVFKEAVPKYAITVQVADGQSEWGTVVIDECSCQSYSAETDKFLTLIAEPNTGYEFVEWSDHSKDLTHYVKVGTKDMTYTATFKKKDAPKHTISVSVSDELYGSAQVTGGGTSGQFQEDDKVVLYVTSNPGYVFDQWSDGNTDNPRTITVGKADASYTAYFTVGNAHRITLAVVAGQTGYGKVYFPAVPGKTSYQFKEGASVTIKAEPNPGYKFDQWDDAGADNTSATRTIVLGTNDTIFKASFKEADKVKIEVAVASGQADRGTVSLPDGKTVGDFPIGSSLTLTAKPNPGFAFEKWDDDNTDPVRTITVTKAQTFIASFSEAPETKVYPVTVAGVQLTAAKNSLVAGSDLDGILLAGSIIYNEASASLILNNVNLELDSKDAGILIDGGTDNSNVTVIVVGKCLISVTDTGLSLKNASNITLSGEGDLTILAKEGIVLDKANLTVQMLTLTVNADTGISGSGTETLTVSAAKVSVTGLASGSIINIASLVAQYCSMDADHTFNTSKKWVEITDSKTPATDEVTFTPLPMLEVKPMEAGTGHFELSNGKTKFTDIGWFEAGTEVSIKAIPASGFVFSHWTDNINWKDPDDFVPADKHDVITMPAKDKTYDNFAVFYYKSKSTATWYGVNGNDFISFKLNDFGATVKTASGPDAGDVKVGDYVQNSWVVLNNTTVQAIPFSRLDDGQDLKEPRDLGTTSEDFTDMAYDLLGGKIYAVAGTKLYTIHERTGNVEEVAEFQYKEAAKNVEAIAVNAKRNLYLLSSDDGGVLYTAAISKIKDGKVPMSIVGDEANAGKVGVPVEAGKEQSIAFDHTTGELFWGAKDYIRNINLKTAKATVAADLEQQEGKQGFVKALHNMAKPVIVSVEVADGQDGWGTATIDDDDSKKVISGTTFTITAKANSGYYFSHWEIEGESGVVSDERNYDTSVSEATTFVAYFAEGEGISTITFDPTKKAQKVLVNGIIYILRDGKIYSILGNAVQ